MIDTESQEAREAFQEALVKLLDIKIFDLDKKENKFFIKNALQTD